jgi:transketolase
MRRFESYHWHVARADAYDLDSLAQVLDTAVAEEDRPSLVIVRSHIAYGAPKKQDTAGAHGEPLGAEELAAAKRALGWPETPAFHVPDEVRTLFARRAAELEPEAKAWHRAVKDWEKSDPEAAKLWAALRDRRVPPDILERLLATAPQGAAATRVHGNAVLQSATALVPALVGGSADLEPSTKTRIKESGSIQRGRYEGRNFHFGVREHAMGSILNGMSLHGGFIPYGSTFLVFTDYARPAIRLCALMRLHVIWVLTHDSVFLGEDGPTHQPVEHLTALRAIPNLMVMRPADGPETAGAWGFALERREGPTLIALTRQDLPVLNRAHTLAVDDIRRGAYVVREAAAADAITLIATGSEVWVAMEAATHLDRSGIVARVVSMPCPQLFLKQESTVRDRVLPPDGRRVSLEAGVTDYWRPFVGREGLSIGIDTFGESAPYAQLQEHFALTPDRVASRIQDWMRR